ncbi:hypothetical protein ACP4OV_031890 [Aristida adscensionis]
MPCRATGKEQQQMERLPPGFRFFPTDEELITCYLARKAMDASFTTPAIRDVDLYKSEPWDLPSLGRQATAAGAGTDDDPQEQCYFFCRRGSRYPSGVRARRATRLGYWKSTGKDKGVYSRASGGRLVGTKKTLVFYGGRAPRGEKTAWVMHEYALVDRTTTALLGGAQSEWVICRVFMKKKHQTSDRKLEMKGVVYDNHHQHDASTGHLLRVAPAADSCNNGGGSAEHKAAAPPVMLSSDPRHADSHSGDGDGDDKDRHRLHLYSPRSASPSWLMGDDQLGAYCSTTLQIMQQLDDDPGYLPGLLDYDGYDDVLPQRSGNSPPDAGGEVDRRAGISSASLGSIHLGELCWNFGF